jgi:uncharacterized membrane protein YfcA
MNRTFSIATLLLVMAIVAVALTSLRGWWQQVESGVSGDITELVLVCSVAGAVFGFGLAIWNGASPGSTGDGWLRVLGSMACGSFLGAAAGAQATARVDRYVLLLTPVVVVGCAALVAATRRRRGGSSSRTESSPAILGRDANVVEPGSADHRAPADKPL